MTSVAGKQLLDLNMQSQWFVRDAAWGAFDPSSKPPAWAAPTIIATEQASIFGCAQQQANNQPAATTMYASLWSIPIMTADIATSPRHAPSLYSNSTFSSVAVDPLAPHLTVLPRIRTTARSRYAHHSRAAATTASPIPLPPPPQSVRADGSQHTLYRIFDPVNAVNPAVQEEDEPGFSKQGDDSEDDAISLGSEVGQEQQDQQQGGGSDGGSGFDTGSDCEELSFTPCSCRAWLQSDSACSLLSL